MLFVYPVLLTGGMEILTRKEMKMDRHDLLALILSTYFGERCKFCLKEFKTLQDLKNTVWCPSEVGRIAHKECWDRAIERNPCDDCLHGPDPCIVAGVCENWINYLLGDENGIS